MQTSGRGAKKVAIIHDWLTEPGGAERVLRQMLLAFPEADLFTVCDFLAPKHRHILEGRQPTTTFIQRLPFARKKHWLYLPLMPFAVEQWDLSEYELVLSSSYCVAKGVLTGPDQIHVSYIHTPIRYAWHLQHQYLKELNLSRGIKSIVVRAFLHYLRIWDLRSAVNIDVMVGNSSYVARQVTRLYRQDCIVLPPPTELDRFSLEYTKDDYYVTASRLVAYKRVDLIVSAFRQMPDRRLVVVGDGPEMPRVLAAAAGLRNVTVLGYQSDEDLRRFVSKAKAFVFAAVEDFGIGVVEAQASGTPVIALARGGSLETVEPLGSESPTGVYFYKQTEEGIIDAVREFERHASEIRPLNCRRNAERFSVERFREGLLKIIERATTDRDRATQHYEEHLVYAATDY